MLAEQWQKIKIHIIDRLHLHTLMSWRFLLPNQSKAIRLQRRVFLGAWHHSPRWKWVLIALYSGITWLLFFSWRQSIYRLKRRKLTYTTHKCHYPPLWRQVVDLFSAAFLHGIPPRNYYKFGLFRKPRSLWLDYIYSNSLPHWHDVLSAGVSARTLRLLANKNAFADHMTENGIPAVPTVAFLKKEGPVAPEHIFTGRPLFFKPNTAINAVGCLALTFNRDKGSYTLRLGNYKRIDVQADIVAEINQRKQTLQKDYLIQPLLANHPLITTLCGTERLVTLRLVTALINSEPKALFAILEVPFSDYLRACRCMNIDLTSGMLYSRHQKQDYGYQEVIDRLEGKRLFCWREAIEITERAHSLFPDLPSIGWDLAMTPDGMTLIEGNFNWDVEKFQFIMDEPLLRTELVEAYE